MGILTLLLSIILVFIMIIFISLLLIPFKYRLRGGYDHIFWVDYSLSCIPLLGIRGCWSSIPGEAVQLQVTAAGLPLGLNPGKWGKRKEKKTGKKKGNAKNLSPLFEMLHHLDRELTGSVLYLLRDIMALLKPVKVEISGRIGFDEPHYTGWMAALAGMFNRPDAAWKLEIEPVWDEEHYEFNGVIEGSVIAGGVLLRLTRFLLKRKTRALLKVIRKTRTVPAA